MNKQLLLAIPLFCSSLVFAQTNKIQRITPQKQRLLEKENGDFNRKKALQEAKARGLSSADYEGYIKFKQQQAFKNSTALPQAPNVLLKKKPIHATTQNATNIDFETGDYTGWTLYAGENTVSSFGPFQNLHQITPSGYATDSIGGVNATCNLADTVSRQGLITSSLGNDPFSGIPLRSPMGGNYIARLNRYCTMNEGSILEQNFSVTGNLTFLNYAYAVVLEDGGHLQGEQTYFSAVVLDQLGDTIPGTYVYMQAANGTTPGFDTVISQQASGFVDAYYKPWTPVSVDLSAYVGQNVTVRFTSADCIFGGHSGYAYVDARLDSTSSVPNVWPGDANYDLVADVNDLFYIGWAYGANGPARAGATNTWQAEPSADWGQSTAYGTEFKHADCNGDGTIDLNDTLAISTNYNLNHPFKQSNPANSVNSLSTYRNFAITSSATTVLPNQSFAVDVAIPASASPLYDKIYGVSFKLHVPSQYIASANSNDYSSSFLGTNGTNMITMVREFTASGYIDYCLVKRDQLNSTGAGNLFSVNLTASNFSTTGFGTFTITDVKAMAYNGEYLPIGSNSLSLYFSSPTGIKNNLVNSSEFVLRPNPASDKLFIDGIKANTIKYEVINIMGETLYHAQLTKNNAVDVSNLNGGAYFIKLYTTEGVITKKFIKE